MPYAILRTAKLKTNGNIGGSLAHNYREIETKNADSSKTHENTHSLPNAESVKNAITERLPEKRRSDAVLCIEYMISASPEWEGWNDERRKEFFDKSVQWLEERHGKNNVVATSIHRDETTPHLVAYVVPLDDNGKLNAKKFLGGRATLSKMQTDFANTVKDLGLERGIEGSKAEHTAIKDYYAKVNEPIPKIEKIEIPPLKSFESREKYAERTKEHVIEQIKPKYQYMAIQAKEVRTAQKDASEARRSLVELQKQVQPYLDATRDLTTLQRQKLNQNMMEMSKQIQLEHLKLVEQRKKEREQRQKEQEQAKREEWKKLYDDLTDYQKTYVGMEVDKLKRRHKDDPDMQKGELTRFKHFLMSDKGRAKLEQIEKDRPKREISPELQAKISEMDEKKQKQEKLKSRNSGMER